MSARTRQRVVTHRAEMGEGGQTHTLTVSLLAAALAIGIAVFIVWLPGTSRRTTNQPPNNLNASDNLATMLVSQWPVFLHQPLSVLVPLPSGMIPCENEGRELVIRADPCGSTTKPAFSIRAREEWKSLDLVAAFNDAYAQELKEAGLDSIGSRGTRLSGKKVEALYFHLSQDVVGSMVAETAQVNGSRKIAVDVRSQLIPDTVAPGASNKIVRAFLERVSFSSIERRNANAPSR